MSVRFVIAKNSKSDVSNAPRRWRQLNGKAAAQETRMRAGLLKGKAERDDRCLSKS
jgi:hypothetical protein